MAFSFPQKRIRQHSGFTLVELVVVIAIITVLIALLLPALNKVRDMANTTQCASNLRQAMMALTMYSMQNQGYLPPTSYYGSSSPWMAAWNTAVIRYSGYNWRILDCPGASDWTLDAPWKVTEYNRTTSIDGRGGIPYFRISYVGSIGYNVELCYTTDPRWAGTPWERNFPKLSQLRSPYGVIVMGDSKGGDISGELPFTSGANYNLQYGGYGPIVAPGTPWNAAWGPWQDTWQTQPYPVRHRRGKPKGTRIVSGVVLNNYDYKQAGGNMVFADGHAEFLPESMIHGHSELFKPRPNWPQR